ncbi:nucleoside diphosphate kinase, mitochondrial-like [Canis lupus familiaris]|uniref:nucleoside-diphosphate kinase n=1 Tax=Canis lupus familiaris TaxID=9615 RepID=A0A8I3RWZ3_CANLF|nr:nucleoside diphosphate kinase, mitochondrial-like [Canis lupus dingo]XP_038285575.1 nucleoside diphosphate kinase, mitochondrial-like [Canis lupus familiaris]XP_038312363.1 nucleoside diphosphate kinase, mitochondrial-like [Canis lupus familiaris]XP_038425270.1 nucleoside diphosphate kinase, mitochondrial-like [Canis lupus familiaris]
MGGFLERVALLGLLSGLQAPDPTLLTCPNSSGSSWTWEQTLVAVQPDGVQWRLAGDVIQRFERRDFKVVGMKTLQEHHPCSDSVEGAGERQLWLQSSEPVDWADKTHQSSIHPT